MIVPAAIILIFILLVCALLLRSIANRARDRAALPEGKVLYSDTIKQERPLKTLISWRHGLKGRPDYLIETKEGIVPVEIKSTAFPRSGRPYEAHVMQLICYCLLCEETTGAHVPYGLIRYRNGEAHVEYTPELRSRLLSLLDEMRKAKASPVIHRNHSQPRRCSGCGFREVCGESLYD
ncbi:MAG TPA: CRISPR-associated protein Cas4 [Pyrinomonadaceae bacterium]|nr:CRISPR-associated protein Cas4 [Pyrinomonadaceae bacterium]